MEHFDFSRDIGAGDYGVVRPAPSVFISHGAPSVILDKNGYQAALRSFADKTPRPVAVAVLSAHWLTRGTVGITTAEKNGTIHDFRGFPRELYEMTYPAPGSPKLAYAMIAALNDGGVKAEPDGSRGLDHGAWVPLKIMYPDADIPVVEISIPYPAPARMIFDIGKLLAPFRKQGVMLIGSGSMTHNLSTLEWEDENSPPSRDVLEFEADVMREVESGDYERLWDYDNWSRNPREIHPTDEHFLPLFFTLGGKLAGDVLGTIYKDVRYGTLSMRSLALSSAD